MGLVGSRTDWVCKGDSERCNRGCEVVAMVVMLGMKGN